MPQKSPKTASKNNGRENSAVRRGNAPRKSYPVCECLECSLYQERFKPGVHPCPNFKKKKMAGSKKQGKVTMPKKVVTSRWVVPPKYDSQRKFPRCRCLPPLGQGSREQLEYSGSSSSRASSTGGKESKPISSVKNERNLREDFYQALEKQAGKTSARSAAPPLGNAIDNQSKASNENPQNYNNQRKFQQMNNKTIHKPDQARREVRNIYKTRKPPGEEQVKSQDEDIIRTNLPRSVSQGLISSETSMSSGQSRASSISKAGKPSSRPSGARTAAVDRSRSKETHKERKLKRESARSPDPLRLTSSSVSFSLSNQDLDESTSTKVSRTSRSSNYSRGVLKDPRSTPIRSNSAKIFLEEEQVKKLQKNVKKSDSPKMVSPPHRNHQEPSIPSRNLLRTVESSISSDDPVPQGRLPPSRQFMNICAQETAKRKLIARSKAAQELDTTDLFGMDRHYEVYSAEAQAEGGTWGIRAYRTIPRL
ncbi:hypothetical protein GE061_008356 [Apolygus lucorum]|uniref:Uncharacterized protein n=1 Tax=Apolygus lucorum TaxID=248454 RepID=A0A6A4IW68_APOLU|nr:hypothetical protein GE061_008356 [Apolygus lucorum]